MKKYYLNSDYTAAGSGIVASSKTFKKGESISGDMVNGFLKTGLYSIPQSVLSENPISNSIAKATATAEGKSPDWLLIGLMAAAALLMLYLFFSETAE